MISLRSHLLWLLAIPFSVLVLQPGPAAGEDVKLPAKEHFKIVLLIGQSNMAGRGKVLPGLLADLLRDAYFRKSPPKTAGREQYGEKYVRRLLAHREARRARAEDVIRTATILTAGILLMAANESFRGLSTLPLIATENLSGSMLSGTSAR